MSYVTTKPAWLAYTGLGAIPPAGFDANKPLNWCGSCSAVQRMLSDLGFYMGEFDGDVTGPVRGSLESFAQSKGLTTSNGITTQVCVALKDAWTKLQGGTVARQSMLAGRVVAKPKLTYTPRGAGPSEPGAGPSESGSVPGNEPITITGPGDLSCPPGYTGIKPDCVPIPMGSGPANACMLQQGLWDTVSQTCIPPDVTPTACADWWACKDNTTKTLIIGGSVAGVALIGLGVYFATRK